MSTATSAPGIDVERSTASRRPRPTGIDTRATSSRASRPAPVRSLARWTAPSTISQRSAPSGSGRTAKASTAPAGRPASRRVQRRPALEKKAPLSVATRMNSGLTRIRRTAPAPVPSDCLGDVTRRIDMEETAIRRGVETGAGRECEIAHRPSAQHPRRSGRPSGEPHAPLVSHGEAIRLRVEGQSGCLAETREEPGALPAPERGLGPRALDCECDQEQ